MDRRQALRVANRAVRRLLTPLARVFPKTRNPKGHVQARKLLVVKLVGMGDAVMIRTWMDALSRRCPGVEMTALAGPATAEALAANSAFSQIAYDPVGRDRGFLGLARLVRRLRRERFDAVIDCEHHLVLVSLVLWLSGAREIVGMSSVENPRRMFQTRTIPFGGEDRLWDVYGKLFAELGAPAEGVGEVVRAVSADAREKAARLFSSQCLERAKVVGLHLGSGGRGLARRWSLPRFAELAERLRAAGFGGILLTGTPSEAELIEEFRGRFAGTVVDGSGLGSLDATAAALVRCRIVISSDTGVMHLAAALGVPTLGLFGPNLPSRYAPVGPFSSALYRTSVSCSPCINIHLGQVPECSHPELGRCLLDISVDDAYAGAMELLARTEGAWTPVA